MKKKQVEGEKEGGKEGIRKEGPTMFFSLSLFVDYKLPNINPLSFIPQFSFPKSAVLVSVYSAA